MESGEALGEEMTRIAALVVDRAVEYAPSVLGAVLLLLAGWVLAKLLRALPLRRRDPALGAGRGDRAGNQRRHPDDGRRQPGRARVVAAGIRDRQAPAVAADQPADRVPCGGGRGTFRRHDREVHRARGAAAFLGIATLLANLLVATPKG
jgi:Mechanosensitive ion channel, conserved TM helix